MFTFQEYQLQIPTPSPRILGRISEQVHLEEQHEQLVERGLLRTKTQKYDLKPLPSSKLIPISNKLPRLSSSKHDPERVIRSITDNQSPSKQLTMKSFKTNTENDTDDEKTRTKYKRDDVKRITTNYRAGLQDTPSQRRLSEQISRLIHQLITLKDYLNNSRKLFLVIRNVVGNRKTLKRILIKHGKEELVEFQDITKLCSVKEFVNINGEQKLIEKLNVQYLDDVIFANESLENLLVQNKIQEIRRKADHVCIYLIDDQIRKK